MQVYFSIGMTDKKTYQGRSEIFDLYISDIPSTSGFWAMFGLNMIGFFIIVGLVLAIIIASIILLATKACKRCREGGMCGNPHDGPIGDPVSLDFTEDFSAPNGDAQKRSEKFAARRLARRNRQLN